MRNHGITRGSGLMWDDDLSPDMWDGGRERLKGIFLIAHVFNYTHNKHYDSEGHAGVLDGYT